MKNNHLTLEDRKQIQEGLENELSRTEIAKNINKDISTVAKEIKNRRKLKPRNPFNNPITCTKFKQCGICHGKCSEYEEIKCTRRDRKVGVCNLCPDISKCRLDKYFYYAKQAHEAYQYTLKDSREGVNLNTKEMLEIVDIIKPLLKKGQSVYQILRNHPEIKMCSKTLYMYIESGIFQDYGINNFSLRRQVSMRQRKKLKKRKEPVNYEGRRYKDYLEFVEKNPTIPTTQMDTVYNQQEGPYIQTFIFQNTGLMIGFLHEEKTSESMASTLDNLQEILEEDYIKLFSLLLTDRGAEFEKYELFEVNTGTGEIRTNIFYCDPQTPSQKPHVENINKQIRKFFPKGKSIDNHTKESVKNHNITLLNTPIKSLDGNTPKDAFITVYGEDLYNKIFDIVNDER